MYGKYTVTLKSQYVYGDITERKMYIAESNGDASPRKINIVQLSSWPLGQLPHPTAILSLMDLLSKAQRNSPSRHTIIMCRYIYSYGVYFMAHKSNRGLTLRYHV